MNVNTIISQNILFLMKEKGKKKEDLAAAMRMSSREIIWMLNGRRRINAVELKAIAGFLEVGMKELTKLPSSTPSSLSPTPTPTPFSQKLPSTLLEKEKEREGVREAMKTAEELAEMVNFHERMKENGEEMRKSWK